MATIHVTGRDAEVTARNRKHAEVKLTKLAKYFKGIVKIEATLGHTGDSAAAEVVISIPRGRPLVCRSRAQDLYAAVDLVLDKAETQLTKHKERLKERKTHRGQGSVEGEGEVGEKPQEAGLPTDDDKLESYDEVIEKRDFQ